MPGMAAEGWPRGSDKDRATGLHPWSVMFYPQGCCYHLCSCGPLSAAGKGTGKALLESGVPIQPQPVPSHLPAVRCPLPQCRSATGCHCPLWECRNKQGRHRPPQEGTRLEGGEGTMGLELSEDI